MYRNRTVYKFRDFILLQNFVCINRSIWLGRGKLRMFGNFMFLVATTTLITTVLYDIFRFFNANEIFFYKFSVIILQCVVCCEVVFLAFLALIYKKTLSNMKILNEKCDIFLTDLIKGAEHNFNNFMLRYNILSISTIIFDAIGLKLLGFPPSTILSLTIAFAAHDTELIFRYFIMNEFNKRLSMSTAVSAKVGMKIYRHIITAASSFNEEYSLSIAVMFTVTTITSTIYGGLVFLGNPSMMLTIYLVCRQLRSTFSLIMVCSSAYNTSALCKNLMQSLAARLYFEFKDGDKSTSIAQKLTKRWLDCVKTFQPKYSDVTKYTLSLSMPMLLVDVVFNYILILAQILNAIKKSDSSFSTG